VQNEHSQLKHPRGSWPPPTGALSFSSLLIKDEQLELLAKSCMQGFNRDLTIARTAVRVEESQDFGAKGE
jgi:hypothetical protein